MGVYYVHFEDCFCSAQAYREIYDARKYLFTTSSLRINCEVFNLQANGASCPDALKMYEDQVVKLQPSVEYTKCSAFVPSFLEDWLFYQIFFKRESNGTA
jgi:hypothetical protein